MKIRHGACGMCGGDLHPLGRLGNREHYVRMNRKPDPVDIIMDRYRCDTHSHFNLSARRDEFRAERGTWHTPWFASWADVLTWIEEHKREVPGVPA